MRGSFLCSAVLVTLFFLCGCVVQNPILPEQNSTRFAERVNASQIYYDRMVQDDPRNATAWCIRGMYYIDAFGQYEKALQSCDRGLGLDPENAVCWYSKGITLHNMKRFGEAKTCLDRANRIDPTFPAQV
ncbi:MAG: Tetratricopeptide repeat protein [Methanoregula sp. PtaU1.Bin051]|nr:MAG: Tetratricopeptide repeat protein [Methanoregula sp. PtaU1.Bin051]